MLKRIEYWNVRSEKQSFELGRHVIVSGDNGVGKSSLILALCYGLTGMGPDGSRSPKYALLDPNLPLSVLVETQKRALIRRAMSSTGAQTLSLEQGGIPRTLSQCDFELLLGCSSEVVLAGMVPGYFMAQTHVKQSGILSELAPPMKRSELLKEILGGSIDQRFTALVDSDRSHMAVEAEITGKRRELDKRLAGLEAVVDRLQKELLTGEAESAKPLPLPSQARMLELEELRNQHGRYMTARYGVEEIRSRRWAAEKKIGEIAKKSEQILNKIKALGDFDSSEEERKILEKLRASFRDEHIPAAPREPAIFKVVEDLNCPSCGQTVALRHKEGMRAKNKLLMEKFQSDLDYWSKTIQKPHEEKLASIDKDIVASEALVKQALANEKLVTGWQSELLHINAEENQLRKVLADSEPEFPKRPTAEFDETEYRAEVEKFQAASKEQGAAEARQKRLSEARVRIEEERSAHREAEFDQKAFVLVEKAMKALPGLQLDKLKDLLQLPEPWMAVVTGKSIEIFDGRKTPYAMLSTGERLRVDCLICLKINSLQKRPINLLLVDNAELMADREWLLKLPVQTYQFLVEKDAPLTVSPL